MTSQRLFSDADLAAIAHNLSEQAKLQVGSLQLVEDSDGTISAFLYGKRIAFGTYAFVLEVLSDALDLAGQAKDEGEGYDFSP